MTDLLRRIQTLDVGSIYYFFELELANWGVVEPLRFHANGIVDKLSDDGTRYEPISKMMYRGNEYTFAGVEIDGIQLSNDGKVNVPTFRIQNQIDGVQGAVSALCMLYGNLVGSKLTFRITTAEAYENGSLQEATQIWYIDRKESDTLETVSFELTSPLDFKKQQVPTRLISDICVWAMRGEYRGESCGYTGTKYFDEAGNPVDSIVLDQCGGLCKDCILRFGEGNELPFGGFMIPNRTNY